MIKAENERGSVQDFHRKLGVILNELLEKNGVEVFGNLKIEVANMDTLALMKRNKIYMNINAMGYPKYILKYIVAHELAHLLVKRHTKKFWQIVKRLYPQYERGKDGLLRRLP